MDSGLPQVSIILLHLTGSSSFTNKNSFRGNASIFPAIYYWSKACSCFCSQIRNKINFWGEAAEDGNPIVEYNTPTQTGNILLKMN